MTDHDDERPLREAFAQLRADEAQRAPRLAQLAARARAEDERATRSPWLRVALPLAGAAAAGFAWWISAGAPSAVRGDLAELPARAQLDAPDGVPRVIALGSLRSPTDALLAPPLAALPSGFSDSLIPAPAEPASLHDQQSRVTPARRSPA